MDNRNKNSSLWIEFQDTGSSIPKLCDDDPSPPLVGNPMNDEDQFTDDDECRICGEDAEVCRCCDGCAQNIEDCRCDDEVEPVSVTKSKTFFSLPEGAVHLAKGCRIRGTKWATGSYIYVGDDGDIMDNSGMRYRLHIDDFSTDWELAPFSVEELKAKITEEISKYKLPKGLHGALRKLDDASYVTGLMKAVEIIDSLEGTES